MKNADGESTVLEYAMLIETEQDGTFNASFPDLPGCFTQGDSLEELQAHAKEAVSLYIKTLEDLGRDIPRPRHRLSSVQAEVPVKRAG